MRNGLGTPLEMSPQNGKYWEWEGIGAPSEVAPLIPADKWASFSEKQNKTQRPSAKGSLNFFASKPTTTEEGRKDAHHSSVACVIPLAGVQCLSLEHSTVGWNPAWKLRDLVLGSRANYLPLNGPWCIQM